MQFLGGGGVITYFNPSSAFDPATLAWVAAVIANGGTVSGTRETIVDSLIRGLKSDGLFTKLDRLWLFAAENQPSALTDIIADALATAVNSPTFTTDRGYTGTDASTTIYIDSGFNPSTAGGNYTQNSAHISMWHVTHNASSASGGVAIGLDDNGGLQFSDIRPYFTDTNSYFSVNDGNASISYSGLTDTGHFLCSRTGASQLDAYVNATNKATGAPSSQSLHNANYYILATHDVTNGAQTGDGNQVAMSSLGGGLSSTDVTNFYNRLRTYMTAVGVP